MSRHLLFAAILLFAVIPLNTFANKVGGGDLNFAPANADPVLFSHENHVIAKSFKCSACHFHTFQMKKGAYKLDMTTMTKGGFCGRCHNGGLAFNVTDEKNCHRCHHKQQAPFPTRS
ncbi:MAG TPA: c(7)-type cytochrome triheme domain-containing protein [Nitrospirota bacterium]|nr:c(7)-type cytochrome triheme domain-containing protein [Nitrospirota bacterium]